MIYIFCPNCRNSLSEETEFCPNCGMKIIQNVPQVAQVVEQQPSPVTTVEPTKKNEKGNNNIIFIIIIVIAIIFAGFFGFKYNKVKKDYDNCISKCNNDKKANNQTNDNTNSDINKNNDVTNNNNNNTNNSYTPGVNNIDINGSFFAYIEDVFMNSGQVVVTVHVERGTIQLNDLVDIVGIKDTFQTVVTRIESYNQQVDEAKAGNYYGITLSNVNKDDLQRGQAMVKPGSVTPHTKFKATINTFTKEEGGRYTPFYSDYRPQFAFGTTVVTGVIKLPENIEMVNPGDSAVITVELIVPLAMEVGTNFRIYEGGRAIGSGTVTELLD